MEKNHTLNIRRTRKPIKLSPKLLVVYLIVLVFLIVTLRVLVKPRTETEERLLTKLAKNPEDIQLNFNVAEYYFAEEKYSEAIRYYNSGLALSNEDENLHYLYKLGLCYLYLEEPGAIEYLEKVSRAGYKDIGLEENLALAYLKQGNFYLKNMKEGKFGNYSKTMLQELVKTNFIKSYEVFAGIKDFKIKFSDNVKYLELRLLEIDSRFDYYFKYKSESGYSNIKGLLFTGEMYKDIRDFEKSKQVLSMVLNSPESKNTDKYEALMIFGWMFFDDKQYSQALKYYKNAKTELNTAKVNYWLGKTYEQLNMKEEAIKHIKIALKMDPNYPDAKKKLKDLE